MGVINFAVDGKVAGISVFICQKLESFTGGEIFCLGYVNKGCQSVK